MNAYSRAMSDIKNNYLEILGFEANKEYTSNEIRKRYFELALIYHPDKCYTSSLSKEECENKFKELTLAYNYLNNADYDSKNKYTWSVLIVDYMIKDEPNTKLELQLIKAVIKYYLNLRLFCRFLFNNNYNNYFTLIKRKIELINNYQLLYYTLDLFTDIGIPIFSMQLDGFMQKFPEETQTETPMSDNLSIDIYIPDINKIIEEIKGKFDIMDSNNLDTNITDEKVNYVKNIMSYDKKLRILNRYCVHIDEINKFNIEKINNIIIKYKIPND